MATIEKKIFKHGGSFALDLPKEFVSQLSGVNVIIESSPTCLTIRQKTDLDTIEDDPDFGIFISAIAKDALGNPEKLHDIQEVWDNEWEDLLEGVEVDED